MDRRIVASLCTLHADWVDHLVCISSDMIATMSRRYGFPITKCRLVYNGTVDPGHSGRVEPAAKAVDAPSDPTWICRATGEMRANWSAFGPDGKFDSLRWGSPPTIVPMLNADAPAELILPDTTRNVPKRNDSDEISVAPSRPAPPPEDGKPDKVDAA